MQRLEMPGQTAFLVSPSFGYDAATVASLLTWHIAWHRKLGIDITVLYVLDGVAMLESNMQIQVWVGIHTSMCLI